jgi:hypothetical protein
MTIDIGESVLIVLHSPREKLLGILDEIAPAGVFARVIDLAYFDDWCRSIANNEPYLPMNDCFIPMWRVERITRDEGTEGLPSMSDQFEGKTGKKLEDM